MGGSAVSAPAVLGIRSTCLCKLRFNYSYLGKARTTLTDPDGSGHSHNTYSALRADWQIPELDSTHSSAGIWRSVVAHGSNCNKHYSIAPKLTKSDYKIRVARGIFVI